MKKNVFILFTILLFLASCNNDSDKIMSKEKISIELEFHCACFYL